ncbi:translation initiation factor eIF-2B subunit delta-like [Bufo bufo]|uniref:translation initiation factor eIF-2B subunit delta-like n=1 Tax=Bufo bufo TaxID=8384 RepID=UPI001ABE95EA|nr:translation initiation factor eIF-2B subunit delta-like [Bufo bufo]
MDPLPVKVKGHDLSKEEKLRLRKEKKLQKKGKEKTAAPPGARHQGVRGAPPREWTPLCPQLCLLSLRPLLPSRLSHQPEEGARQSCERRGEPSRRRSAPRSRARRRSQVQDPPPPR